MDLNHNEVKYIAKGFDKDDNNIVVIAYTDNTTDLYYNEEELRGSVVFKIVKLIPERYFQFLNDKLD
jgi:hypothetical protein